MHLLDDLAWRGLAYQDTNEAGLREHLTAPRSVYAGFDPTASSLTIGNLVPLLLLARFQRAGHNPVALVGGGTGLIGDPSGKSAERPVRTTEEVEANVESIRKIFERFLDFSGTHAARIVNNVDWLRPLTFLEVLRDVGKHFSVNMMIQKDSVKERLHNREQGISYTEFSYMLLQAYDFLHLFDQDQVSIQVAGSDQWGNIVAGVDLIRRVRRAEAFGLTAPLVTKADGGKFGKTESGAVWLSPDRTSPYAFYQFWLNADDADVPKFLKVFTFFEHARIDELSQAHAENPGARTAHRALAAHVTELVHGKEGLAQAESATQALFSGDVTGLSKALLDEVFQNAPSAVIERDKLSGEGLLLIDFLVDTQVSKSKREARELLSTNAILVNGRRATPEDRITSDWLLHGELALIRRGKKTWHIVRVR
ncbi:MAG TPA: tyrosine--tRNA ligase [Polyangiaceae bacterium]|jgi:tyrosyl-tRNA synthetase|nr:tyrosine--tRNA ligase [Polyangiaceae bacterium]